MTGTRLAVLPNWLGDLVMAEPALRAWRRGHRLVALVEPALASLVEDAGLADVVEVIDRRGRDRGLRGIWRRGRALRSHGAQAALVLGPSLRAAAWPWAAGIPRRVGLGGEGREFLLTEVVRAPHPPRSEPLADTWTRLAGGGDRPMQRPAIPRWEVGPRGARGWEALARSTPRLATERLAVYSAGATYGPAKQWDAASFARLARMLHASHGLHPVFVGAPSEGERTLAEALAKESAGTSLAGHTDLPTLAAVLAAATVCVANDSGPMHLAAALGTPTVGIFGSTSPQWTGPRGRRARSVGPSPVPCAPCFLRTCPYARECFAGIRPPSVHAVVEALLGDSAAKEHA